MLSLIICSRTPRISKELEKNIAETIGCEYELVVIDNSKNKYSIFSAYNEGVRRSKGDILCFMHDDILYKTNEWGNKVIEVLNDTSIGCIGVIGGHYLFKNSSMHSLGINSGNILQGDNKRRIYSANLWQNDALKRNKNIIEVASVDGLWMVFPKTIFKEISFDEHTYSGFHCYDADICMQVQSLGKKIVVLMDCLIEHKSVGNIDDDFFINEKKWGEKWSENLPIMRGITWNDIDVIFAVLQQRKVDFLREKERYESVSRSHAFRLGCFLLSPVYFIKSILKR